MVQESQASEGRGLLTDTERAALAGEKSDSYRYKTRSYLKRRIEKVERDAEVMAEHAPDLLADLRAAVDAVEGAEPRERRESAHTLSTPEEDTHVAADEPTTAPNSGDAESDALAGVEYPSGKAREECNAAVQAARAHLAENERATKREIVAEVMPEHPAGYDADAALAKIDDGDRYRGAWWRKVVKPGLETFDDVAKPPRGASEWRFTGDE